MGYGGPLLVPVLGRSCLKSRQSDVATTYAVFEMRAFLDAIEPLGERAVLWTQLPGSFGPSDVDALGRFLRRLPADRRRAVEVRHPGFFTDAGSTSLLEGALADADAEWVPFDTT